MKSTTEVIAEVIIETIDQQNKKNKNETIIHMFIFKIFKTIIHISVQIKILNLQIEKRFKKKKKPSCMDQYGKWNKIENSQK